MRTILVQIISPFHSNSYVLPWQPWLCITCINSNIFVEKNPIYVASNSFPTGYLYIATFDIVIRVRIVSNEFWKLDWYRNGYEIILKAFYLFHFLIVWCEMFKIRFQVVNKPLQCQLTITLLGPYSELSNIPAEDNDHIKHQIYVQSKLYWYPLYKKAITY